MGKRIGNFNLVNYRDHPTNEIYKVMNFNSKEEADLFEKKMITANLWYEKDVEDHQDEKLYLFAIKNREFDLVQRINFEVNAQFRKPFIPNKAGRYVLVGFFLLVMTIALIGYFKSNY